MKNAAKQHTKTAERQQSTRILVFAHEKRSKRSFEELHVGPGDEVKEMDVIAVVETDKVSLDIRANRSGTVQVVLVELGEEVKERQPLFSLVEGTATAPL